MVCNNEKDEFSLCADEKCFPCKIKSIQISPYATPTRQANRGTSAPPKGSMNSWERGIPRDGRGMPYLRADGEVMGQKEFSEKRTSIEAEQKRRRQSAQPFEPAKE